MSVLKVSRKKIAENARRVLDLCSRGGITVSAVAKGVCAHPEIIKILWESGYRSFGDSRLENIRSIRNLLPEAEITLIRPPAPSDIPELPLYANNILVSMIDCLQPLDDASEKAGRVKPLGIILMIEIGDLRDGIMPDEVEIFTDALRSFNNLKLKGVAVNFACFGGICPTEDKLEQLVNIKTKLEKSGHDGLLCSGGSSSSLLLIERGEMPRGINGLRVGEAILLGTDVAHNRAIEWLNRDTMILESEIIELRRKPSVPFGKSGFDAFGGRQEFEDRGERLRGITAVGRQDVNIGGVTPLLEGVEILGASSDHLILDLESVKENLRYGDKVAFTVNYPAMLALFTSEYIKIEFV